MSTVTYYFVYLLETIRCDTATVYLLYRISSAQIYTHLQKISGLVWSGYSLIWNSPDLLIMFHRLLFKAKFIKKKTLRLNLDIKKSYLGCTAEQFGQVLQCSLIDCVLLFCFASYSDQPAQTASLICAKQSV